MAKELSMVERNAFLEVGRDFATWMKDRIELHAVFAVQKRAVSEAWAKAETLEGMRIKAHRRADKKLMEREKVDGEVDALTLTFSSAGG